MNPQDETRSENKQFVPVQLQVYPLIRVCRPNCSTHTNCSSQGKRPVTTVEDSESIKIITDWISDGGNVGTVARSNNDLVIIDSDSKRFSEIVFHHLPETFTVESGGSGFGEHIYYKSDYSENKGWNDPEGSIRSSNWMCVCPPSSHESGGLYEVINNSEIATVSESELTNVVEEIESLSSTDVKRGGSGGGSSPPAPSSHKIGDLDFIKRDDIRSDISEILHTESKHNRRVWMVGWLHGAAGLTQSEITDIIMSNARWSDLDRETVQRQVESVIDSSNSDRGTHYTEWGHTADMDGKTSERRKTEAEGVQPSVRQEVSNMEDNDEDNVRNKVTVQRDDGQFARGGIVEVENDGDQWEYAGVVFGEVQGDDEELGTVVSFETNQYGDRDYRNLGDRSPEEIRLAAEALQELADEIES